MSKELKPLTGVRAFAAWGVFLYHFAPGMKTLFPSLRALDWIVGQGDKGVDLFFILSGFVLAYNYADKMRAFGILKYRNFLVMRLARIYPVHLFALGVWGAFAVMNIFMHHSQPAPGFFGLKMLLANLLLVHGWWVPLPWSWNYPAWSISMEWLAYLLFPFLVLILLRVRSTGWAVAMICGLSLTAPLFSAAPYYHFVQILSEFTSGMLLCMLYRRGFASRYNWEIISLISLVLAVFLVHWVHAFIFPVFVVFLYSLAIGRGIVSRALGSSLANFWGRASYSLYMMHAAVLSALHVLLPPQRFATSGFVVRAAVLMLYPIVAAATASITYWFIEEPGRRKIRELARQTRQASPELTTPVSVTVSDD